MSTKPKALSRQITTCKRCKAPIVWARTVASETGPGGRPMPLDPYPNPEGNVAVRAAIGGRLLARVLTKDEDHDHRAEQRAMPHAATCGVEAGRQLADDVEAFLATQAGGQ